MFQNRKIGSVPVPLPLLGHVDMGTSTKLKSPCKIGYCDQKTSAHTCMMHYACYHFILLGQNKCTHVVEPIKSFWYALAFLIVCFESYWFDTLYPCQIPPNYRHVCIIVMHKILISCFSFPLTLNMNMWKLLSCSCCNVSYELEKEKSIKFPAFNILFKFGSGLLHQFFFCVC